jgi:hypothetical protein
MGFAHGHVEKNMIWSILCLRRNSRGQSGATATPFLTNAPDCPECAHNEDVRNLALCFLALKPSKTWHKGVDEFRELCAVLAQDPGSANASSPAW